MQPGRMRGGGRLLIVLGGELSVGKIGNRESNGALDFYGFCWMGGRNNQPKMGRNDGISLGEDGSHRAMTIGEDAAASFVPTDFGAKIKITNFVVGMWPPIDDCTQQPTKLT